MAILRKNVRNVGTSVVQRIGINPSEISRSQDGVNINANTFNPRLIFSQMTALQSIHYLVLSIIFQINHFTFGTTVTIDRMFTAKYLNIWERNEWVDCSAILLSSVIGAFLLTIIVEKSKKCLDFSVTYTTIHLLLCTLYNGFPASWDWWILNVLGMIIMTVLGEFLCSRLELKEIPLL